MYQLMPLRTALFAHRRVRCTFLFDSSGELLVRPQISSDATLPLKIRTPSSTPFLYLEE